MIILNSGSGWEYLIFIAIFFGIIVPVALFIVGLVQLRKNHKRGKTILIIATVYSIISFGLCGGFGF
mgnify:CR=1 FL=1